MNFMELCLTMTSCELDQHINPPAVGEVQGVKSSQALETATLLYIKF